MKDKIAFIDGKKITGTAPTQAAKTWTPTTSNQTIASGTILTGAQTIAGDADLKAANIKSGVNIFGVTGTYAGQTINGIVESYKVASGSSAISAGDFVSYVNNLTGGTINVTSQYKTAGEGMSAVALSDSKVFIAHSYSSSRYLYATVCTISGNTITAGTSVSLCNSTDAGKYAKAVALSDSKVFVAHSYNTNFQLYGIVCTISGTTITKGTDTVLSSLRESGATGTSAVALSDSKVVISHKDSNEYSRLSCMICNISGTTITVASDTLIDNEQYSGLWTNVVKLSDSKVFISHGQGDYCYLWGMVCTISGNTVTAGTDKHIDTGYNRWSAKYTSLVALSESKVFIAHQIDEGLAGIVCTLSGTTITLGSSVLLSGTTPYYSSAVALSSSKVFITHGNSNNSIISTLCHIAGRNVDIIDQNTSTLSSASHDSISSVSLGNNGVFVAFSTTDSYHYLRTKMLSGSVQVTKYIKGIAGVAKTGGSAGATISVVTPN